MAGTAIWSAEARADLKEIAEYIARESRRPETARRLIDEIHNRVNLLATQPLMGEARPEFGSHQFDELIIAADLVENLLAIPKIVRERGMYLRERKMR